MARSAIIPSPNPRAQIDFKIHRGDCEMEEDEKYFEQLSLIKFPTTPEIVAPLDVNFSIGHNGAFHVPTKNKGPEMRKEIVIPNSPGFRQTVPPSYALEFGAANKQNKLVFGAVNQGPGFKLGNGSKLTEVKDQNEADDKLTQDLLQCKEVLAKKQIADPEDIRRATFLLHQAFVRLSKMGYKRTPSEQERSSSSSSSSNLSNQTEQPGKKTKNAKKKN